MFVVTLCHAENVSSASFVFSSEGVTVLASTLDVRCMLVDVFADGTKQTEGRNQFHESRSALQQRVVGCAT